MSESTPVENLTNNGSSTFNRTSRTNKNNDSLVETVNFNLSQGRCQTYFKNNLRGDGSVIQKEHKPYITESSNKKLFDDKKNTSDNNIFEPELPAKIYRCKSPVEENRFNTHYVTGTLKTNIEFDPWATNDQQGSASRMKLKDEIQKELPKPLYNMNKKHPTTVSRRVSDNYGKNIFNQQVDSPNEVNAARQDTIGRIFSSDGLRTAVLKKDSEKLGSTGKIVNTPISIANNIFPSSEAPKYIKTAKKIIMGGQVVYQ